MLFDSRKAQPSVFQKVESRGVHVLLLTPVQINRLDKTQVEGKRAQIRMSARQVAKNVSYTGGFLGMLASLVVRAIPLAGKE